MERYAPEQMELAARDVVARANYHEIRAGRGTPDDAVLLDISHEPMEVAPTAHYPMGGVLVDPDTGASTVPGLFAVGEAASGVHGANRLGGNSLAETLVFGQGLRDGLDELDSLATNARRTDAGSTPSLDALVRALTLPFALLTTRAILRSALLRDESRGAHSREDAPRQRDDWLQDILCTPETAGGMRLRTEPVPAVPAAIRRALAEHHTLDYHHLE